MLDAQEVTGELTVSAAGATGTLTLVPEDHELYVEVANTAAIPQTAFEHFSTTTLPTITFVSPTWATTQAPVTVDVQYSAQQWGIDVAMLHVVLDGTDITSGLAAGNAEAQGSAIAAPGWHVLTGNVADNAGNDDYASVGFTIAAPSPTVSFTAPAAEGLVSDESPVVITVSFR